jgi:hypothetical protein
VKNMIDRKTMKITSFILQIIPLTRIMLSLMKANINLGLKKFLEVNSRALVQMGEPIEGMQSRYGRRLSKWLSRPSSQFNRNWRISIGRVKQRSRICASTF